MKKQFTSLSRIIALSLLMPYTSFAAAPTLTADDVATESPLDQTLIDLDTDKEITILGQGTDTEANSEIPEALFPKEDETESDKSLSSEDNQESATPENPLQSTITAIDKTKEAASPDTATTKNVLTESLANTPVPTTSISPEPLPTKNNTMVEFNYTNEDIINIINALAAKKGVNVIVPLGAQALANKVTLSLPNRITLDEAWSFLQTFLDISGYGMIPRAGMYYITKKNGSIAKEALPLYIVKPEELPNTDERIRYIYYLSNIKVTDAADNELSLLLKEILPPDAGFKLDPTSNGIIISARALEIKALMAIITKLDKVGFLEKFDIIHLRFTTAKDVATMFNESLLKTDSAPNPYHLDTKKTTDATYFSKFTRIIADERTNSLIILGRFQAIERIKDFIHQYIDIKIEAGKSPIHVYNLQYLRAEDLAPILDKIIQQDTGAGTGQSQVSGNLLGGTQRQFGEVKIMADSPAQQTATPGKDETAPRYYGGNKLIIACSSDDWKEIEKLIQNLDQPRSQVLIEVLIANITLKDLKELGTSIRNPDKIPIPGHLNIQTTNLGNFPIVQGTTPNETIKSDLLSPPPSFVGGADGELQGAVISFNDNDGKTWGIADIVKNFDSQNILSTPHVIATNNQKATVSRTEKRLLPDQSSSSGGTTSIAYKYIDAKLSMDITPRISENDVNLQIAISVNNFKAGSSSSEQPVVFTRVLNANTSVGNNNILVIGGLAELENKLISNETPFLSKIPILGWFFKYRSKNLTKTNLTIFIKPIIITPRLRGGLEGHTQEFLGYIDNYTGKNATASSLKDPITRIFFSQDDQTTGMVNDFLRFKQEELVKEQEAPVQHIDLSDGIAMIEKKKNPQAIKTAEDAKAPPKATEEEKPQTQTSRAEQAKQLLKDAKASPLAADKKPTPLAPAPSEESANL